MNDLIYDRTIADVVRLTSKGYYNASDLNRVEEWTGYIKDRFNELGYTTEGYKAKEGGASWDKLDIPTTVELERIRNNITILRRIIVLNKAVPSVPVTLNFLDYIKANDIEKVLFYLDCHIKWMKNYFVKAGVSRAGQERMLQNRFRRY